MKRTEAVTAFIEKRQKKVGTLESTLLNDKDYGLKLHGNTIAKWDGEKLYGTLAGWPTVTTRKWLNDLCDQVYSSVSEDVELYGKPSLCPSMKLIKRCYFYQHKHEQYMSRVISTVRKAEPIEMKCKGVGYILEPKHDDKTVLDFNEWMRIL
tara:strand:- start:2282 stop:2737 length:456 start_codon:yes stop_codon:yes gene_type:complete